ncbi:MATE family efflux transporter [Lentisphaerota bacterium WC36G]|nr:MATE family efflux transporter [Lentisphaerae bacterium WC36]
MSKSDLINNKADVTTGSLFKHVVRMSIPGMGGFFAIVAFNFADTYFVSQLSNDHLTAMGYIFPVVMILHALVMGVSAGSEVMVSHLLGAKNVEKAQEITVAGVGLAFIISIIMGALGIIFLDDIFALMSAKGEPLRLAKEYMIVWFCSMATVFMPPVSDGILRASGDMVRPFWVMCLCAVLNVIFDWLLIFGNWGLPELGIAGAAYATAIARVVAMILSLYFLTSKAKLMTWQWVKLKKLTADWTKILKYGMPASITQLMYPVSRFIFTKLINEASGKIGVGAISAGSRIEYFAQIVPYSISFAIMAIFGQNLGAKKYDRLNHGINLLMVISFVYGVFTVGIFALTGQWLSTIMSKGDLEIEKLTYQYLLLSSIGSGGFYFTMLIFRTITALGKALDAAILNIIQVLIIVIPCVIAGFYLGKFEGLVLANSIAFILSGILLFIASKKLLKSLQKSDLE